MKRNLLPFVVAAALLPAASLFADTPDWSGFAKEVKITFDGYAGATPLENFPVLVRVSAANGFDYAKFKLSGGGDLRFSDADGNLLAHEIDTWTPGGESLVWVKVPRLASDTEIVAHYGNASPVAAPAASDVWSEGYAGVWHMNAAADKTTQADSTANGLDAIVPAAIADGVEAGVAGTVGTAAAFDKRADHNGGYAVPDTSNLLHGQEAMTWEVWAKQASYAAYNAYFFRMYPYAAGESDAYKIYEWANAGRPVAYPLLDEASEPITYWPGDALIPPPNQWNHLVWRYDGKAGTKAVILNGNTSGKYSGTAAKGTILTLSNGGGVTVGNFTAQDSANAFPGSLDEIRISSVARSDAWIAATYATIADKTFASYEAIASGGNDWTKYAKKFRISFPGVGSGVTLTNFPVLVKLSASSPSGFRYADCAKTKGADLRFADENGNALDSEVETWNDANGESFVWVKIPELTSSTLIRGYYGWAEAPAADDSAVWSDGFLAVWHLDAATGSESQSDSTSARRSLALIDAAGVRPGVDGVAGKAAMFNVSDNHKGVYAYENSDGALTGLTNMTVEVWTKTTGAPSYNNGYLLFCERDGATAYTVYQKKDTATLTCDYYYDKDGTATYFWGDSTVVDENDWVHVAFRYDGSNGRTSVVLNGVAKPPRTPGCYGLMAGTGKFFLGNRANSWVSHAFPGSIDEVRISNVARSDAWLAATRATIADNAAFTTYGAASDNSQGTVVFFR